MLQDAATTARHMIRRTLKGALATSDAANGAPFASMILLATSIEGAPLTLVSDIARHTRNVLKSPIASILIDTSNPAGDTTSGGRISLMGRFAEDTSATSRSRFLTRHRSAVSYADFPDFRLYRMDIDSGHLIEGFGRIITLPGSALNAPIAELSAFAAAEPACVKVLQQRWPTVTGIDCEGVDLAIAGVAHRFVFKKSCDHAAAAQQAAADCLADANII